MVNSHASAKYQQHRPDDVSPLDFYKPALLPSPPDGRDYKAAEHDPALMAAAPPEPLPDVFALDDDDPAADQSTRGSCAAFQACGLARREFRNNGDDFDPSEEAEYALSRSPDWNDADWRGRDDGSYPRVHMKILAGAGVLREEQAPYLSRDLFWTPEPALLATVPANHKIARYYVCQSDEEIKRVVYGTVGPDGVRRGREVAACFTLYKNFGPDGDGNIPGPAGGVWGGHAMRIVGWDDGRGMPDGTVGSWIAKNQWRDWGLPGSHCYISYHHAALPVEQGGLWRDDLWVVNADPVKPEPIPTDDRYTHALTAAQAVVSNIAAGAGSKPMSRDRKMRYNGASEVLAAVKSVEV